jgi:hypothetical protein
VSVSIDAGGLSELPDRPAGTARAEVAEADTAQPIATELRGESTVFDGDDAARVEHERLARLRRWQAER